MRPTPQSAGIPVFPFLATTAVMVVLLMTTAAVENVIPQPGPAPVNPSVMLGHGGFEQVVSIAREHAQTSAPDQPIQNVTSTR